MEGAAFHFVCLREEIPFMQIRVVSNYVEPRNKNSWNIPLAIANLNDFLRKYLNTI
jgi:futalosine hydrolase